MEALSALRPSVGICCAPVKSGFLSTHIAPDSFRFRSNSSFSGSRIKLHPSIPHAKRVSFGSARCNSIRASLSPSNSGDSAEVDEHLQQLQSDDDADKQKDKPSVSGKHIDRVLNRRIAEVRTKKLGELALDVILEVLTVVNLLMNEFR